MRAGSDQADIAKLPQTPQAKNVITYAIEEARKLNHNYVGTEHLLLGLMRWQNGGAVNMLWALGISPVKVRRNVRQMLQAVHLEVGLEEARRMTNFSELALRVLNGAIEQAAQAGHATVGMEHLLLVLCQDSRNVGGRVLREMGVSVPVVVRLEGTNVDKGRELLANSGLDIIAAEDLTDAAKKVVAAAA